MLFRGSQMERGQTHCLFVFGLLMTFADNVEWHHIDPLAPPIENTQIHKGKM